MKPKFDPSKPFEVANQQKPKFDPSQPFEEKVDSPISPTKTPSVLDQYKLSQQGSPQSMLVNAYDLVQRGADKAGGFVADTLAKGGVDPRASAGAGTFVQMVPDIIGQASIPSISKGAGESGRKILKRVANPATRRALGFTKQHLRTPFARGKAVQAAEVALEKDIFPVSGNPLGAFDKTQALRESTGESIGKILKRTPVKISDAIGDLTRLKEKLTLGTDGGVFKSAGNAVDEVVETITQISKGKSISAQSLADIRRRLSKSINFLSDLASQSDSKAIQGEIKNTIRKAVNSLQSPEIARKFAKDNRLYESYELITKGLNNELASQMGNRPVGLDTAVVGAGQLATGNPAGAMATIGALEGLKRRGMGATASILNKAANSSPGVARSILQSFPVVGKAITKQAGPITEQEAVDYLRKAGGDISLAREMANRDGRIIPE